MNKRTISDVAGIPRDASISTLSIWAKELRSKGSYEKAENCYSRAIAKIEASTKELPAVWMMEMLEGRAYVKSQIGQLEAALDDGNRMLTVDKTNPMGYICLGSLLELKKKPKSAMKCYAHGLKQCLDTHPKYKALAKAREILVKTLSEGELAKTKRDPISTFPTEILFLIFSYLPLRDLLKCHRVSRFWRAVATSDRSLYQFIDFTQTRKPITLPSIKALIRYSGGIVRNLTMGPLSEMFTPSVFSRSDMAKATGFKNHVNMHLGSLFKHLEVLELFGNTSKSPNSLLEIPTFPVSTLRYLTILGDSVNWEGLQETCNTAKGLEYLEFNWDHRDFSRRAGEWKYPSVKVLKIVLGVFFHDIDPQTLLKLLNWFPNVEEFGLKSAQILEVDLPWKCLKVARLFGISRCDSVIIRSEELVSLELNHITSLSSVVLSPQPFLQELCLIHVYKGFQNLRLFQSTDNAKTIKKLTISSSHLEVRDVDPFFLGGTDLTHVNINGLRYVNDATLTHLYPHKFLERLEINNCEGVTGHGVIQLVQQLSVKKGGQLKTISAAGNESIRRQTIDWARGLGVIVSI